MPNLCEVQINLMSLLAVLETSGATHQKCTAPGGTQNVFFFCCGSVETSQGKWVSSWGVQGFFHIAMCHAQLGNESRCCLIHPWMHFSPANHGGRASMKNVE